MKNHRNVDTVSLDTAINMIKDAKTVMYRNSAFDEFNELDTNTVIEAFKTFGDNNAQIDIFLGKNGKYHLSRPTAKSPTPFNFN